MFSTLRSLSILLLFSSSLFAGPTEIAPAFNNGAAVIYNGAIFRSSVSQADGKLLVSGEMSGSSITLRYNSDGSLDSSFNGTGIVRPGFAGNFGIASIALQQDGKIVVAGTTVFNDRFNNFSYYPAIARYNTDGTLDKSFDGDGKVDGQVNGSVSGITAIGIQSDQKIVVINRQGKIFRFNANGTLDLGYNQPFVDNFSSTEIRSLAVQQDDKIIVARGDSNFVVYRLNTNGTLDNSFNGTGRVITDFGNYARSASVIVQPDGKLLVSGYIGIYPTGRQSGFALARYNADGSPDTGFDGDGKVTTDYGIRNASNYSLAIQKDGKIIENGAGIIARFNVDGSPDLNFYYGGKKFTEPGVNILSTPVAGNTLYLAGTYNTNTGYLYVISLENDQKTGVNYRYYEGSWLVLPDFFTVPLVKSGFTNTVDVSAIPPTSTQFFGLVWEGYLNIQKPGTYTFETVSDDGSMMFFNSFYNFDATPLINNDGRHSPTSVSKTVNITQPGKYPIAVTYFESTGLVHPMEFFWSGPRFERQPVPGSILSPRTQLIDSTPPTVPGNLRVVASGKDFVSLAWDSSTDNSNFVAFDIIVNGVPRYYPPVEAHYTVTGLNANTTYTFAVRSRDYEGNRSAVSNYVTATTGTPVKQGLNYKFFNNINNGAGLEGLTPFKTGTTNNTDISQRPQGIDNNYAFIWEGYIYIPTAGMYTFETVSDDGSKVFFNSLYSEYNIPIINNFYNNGEHAVLSVKGTVDIPAPGYYPIGISYRQYKGDQAMQLFWQGPGLERQLVPDAAFSYEPPQPAEKYGLKFSYYEGAWRELPNFNELIPVRSGMTFKPDLSIELPERTDNFAILWEGYINIPAAGNYTFQTISDDGSKFYFNSRYDPSVMATVENDGEHTSRSVIYTVNVPAPGRYPVAITYFERDKAESMEVYWIGPGISRELIPSVAFTQEPPPPPAKGLNFKYYEGAWLALPDFNTLTPVNTYKSTNVDISLRTRARNDYFAFLWEGTITIPAPGLYTFETVSDDGSKLYFNSLYSPAATATVNNDGIHAPTSATGTVNITSAGVYPIAISYFEREGGEQMQVYWTGPGIPRQRIPDEAFAGTGSSLQSIITRVPVATSTVNAEGMLKQVSVYPNPFDKNIMVGFYNNLPTNDINIGIYDLNGKPVSNYHAGKLAVGNNTVSINVNKLPMTDGIYMVRLEVNGISLKTYKLVRVKR